MGFRITPSKNKIIKSQETYTKDSCQRPEDLLGSRLQPPFCAVVAQDPSHCLFLTCCIITLLTGLTKFAVWVASISSRNNRYSMFVWCSHLHVKNTEICLCHLKSLFICSQLQTWSQASLYGAPFSCFTSSTTGFWLIFWPYSSLQDDAQTFIKSKLRLYLQVGYISFGPFGAGCSSFLHDFLS